MHVLFGLEYYFLVIPGLMGAVTVLPIVKSTSRSDATLDGLMKDDTDDTSFRYDCYNNERFRAYMQHLLPYFDKLGLLD